MTTAQTTNGSLHESSVNAVTDKGSQQGSTKADRAMLGLNQLTVSELMHKAISYRIFPGGAVAFGTCNLPCFDQAFGTYTYESSMVMTPQAVWDMASLTKIMATVPAVMMLYDRRMIDLDAPACLYVPEFGANGKDKVTVRMLLTHTAGLREFHPFFDMGLTTADQVTNFIMKDKLWYPSGAAARYSDLSMIVLAFIVEAIVQKPFSDFVEQEFYKPLGMRQTGFRPLEHSDFDPIVVPTEVDILHRRRLLWGEVHDPTAWLLGGVAGHAGLFSSILDVSRFAQMVLAGGIDQRTGRRYFQESTLHFFSTPALPTPENPRPFALGWDVSSRRGLDGYTSAGQYMGPQTFGHTGFTGTSLWIDPERNLFVALLTNSVHPTVEEPLGFKLRHLRPLIADACVLAMEQQAIPWEPVSWYGASQANCLTGSTVMSMSPHEIASQAKGTEVRQGACTCSIGGSALPCDTLVGAMCGTYGRSMLGLWSKKSKRWLWMRVTSLVVVGVLVRLFF